MTRFSSRRIPSNTRHGRDGPERTGGEPEHAHASDIAFRVVLCRSRKTPALASFRMVIAVPSLAGRLSCKSCRADCRNMCCATSTSQINTFGELARHKISGLVSSFTLAFRNYTFALKSAPVRPKHTCLFLPESLVERGRGVEYGRTTSIVCGMLPTSN